MELSSKPTLFNFFFYKFRAVSFEFPLFLTSYLDEGNRSGSLLVLMILLVVF